MSTFRSDKPPSKNTIALPEEKSYVSYPLFGELGADTSEEETMTSQKSTNKNREEEPNRLVFEMIQEDFQDTLNEEAKIRKRSI